MKKFYAMILCTMLTLMMLLSAVSSLAEGTEEEKKDYFNPDYQWEFVWNTKGISKLKSKAATQQGTVETLTYTTPAYAVNAALGTDYEIEKTLHVYLPYGYDPEKSYNVLYLMHGGGDDQDYWLTDLKGDRSHGKTTRRVIDHMIEDGLCEPLIIVTPTTNASVPDVEVEGAQYTWYFGDEFRNVIVPLVEAKYSTYAKGDVSIENLIATRDHRAFAGLSMGSITSFQAILAQNFDLISWCGSWSAGWSETDRFREAIETNFADYEFKFWYNGEGVDDFAFDGHYEAYYTLMNTMSNKFVDGQNSVMVVLSDGAHNYAAWIVELYNCLLVFFK